MIGATSKAVGSMFKQVSKHEEAAEPTTGAMMSYAQLLKQEVNY